MAEQLPCPSSAVRQRRPSSAGDVVDVRHRNNGNLTLGSAEGASAGTPNSALRERPETAPSGGAWRARQRRAGDPAGAQKRTERWQPKKERGVSARVVEARLDELRGDDDYRKEFLLKVNGIVQRRNLYDHGSRRRLPKTRKDVQLELRRAHPLDTERKADLVQLLRSEGLEANRATQTLLDPETKAVLTRRVTEGRRARETRIRDLVLACRKHRRDQLLAARENQAIKDEKIKARRGRAKQARGQMAQTKGWLTALKMHTAITWAANGRAGVQEGKRRSEAAKIITRHVITVARHRFLLRLEAATKVIDNQFAKKIRRWKTKRDAEATTVLKRFLTDVKSSNVRTKVKLLAYRVAHAHVQLARLQRWWRRRRQEMAACRRVMCRLWDQEVDRRIEEKVDEIWRARIEAASLVLESSYHHHPHHQTNNPAEGGGGVRRPSSAALRWGAVRHASPSSPGGGGGGSMKDAAHGAAAGKGKSAARQAKEDQARGERATIRDHLLLDPLINPPADLKVRMCREYLKQMTRRHAEEVGDFVKKTRRAADTPVRAAKFSEKSGSLLAVSLAIQARRRVLHAKGVETAGNLVRPRWRTGALPGEVTALVDAGIEYVLGMRWLWEPQTPSRLDDGTLVADSMPTPEDLAGRVASRFRYGGEKLTILFREECTSTLGSKGISTMTRPGQFGCGPDKPDVHHGAPQVAAYAPVAAGLVGEAAVGSAKRVAPLLTYHYLPPSSSSYQVPDDKKGAMKHCQSS